MTDNESKAKDGKTVTLKDLSERLTGDSETLDDFAAYIGDIGPWTEDEAAELQRRWIAGEEFPGSKSAPRIIAVDVSSAEQMDALPPEVREMIGRVVQAIEDGVDPMTLNEPAEDGVPTITDVETRLVKLVKSLTPSIFEWAKHPVALALLNEKAKRSPVALLKSVGEGVKVVQHGNERWAEITHAMSLIVEGISLLAQEARDRLPVRQAEAPENGAKLWLLADGSVSWANEAAEGAQALYVVDEE